MKKILLSCALLLSAIMTQSVYVPTQGPLNFSDLPGGQRSAIYLTAYNNPHLQAEYNTLSQFARTLPPQTQTYQGIIEGITNAQTPLAIQTLEAIERILMHMYHDKAMALDIPYMPKMLGLRQSWANPISYLDPRSWYKDNDPQLKQIIDEIKQLARIATSKNYNLGMRMHARVHAYRHWRKYLGIMLYLGYDRSQREWKDSIIYRLWNDDDFEGIRKNLCQDMTDFSTLGWKQAEAMYNSIKNYWKRTHKEKSSKKDTYLGGLIVVKRSKSNNNSTKNDSNNEWIGAQLWNYMQAYMPQELPELSNTLQETDTIN